MKEQRRQGPNGWTAGNVARQYAISRIRQDELYQRADELTPTWWGAQRLT